MKTLDSHQIQQVSAAGDAEVFVLGVVGLIVIGSILDSIVNRPYYASNSYYNTCEYWVPTYDIYGNYAGDVIEVGPCY